MKDTEIIFFRDLIAIFDSEIEYYRNLYENPKTASKEKAFEYVCKLQALKKLKQRILGSGDNLVKVDNQL
jgi:hypothetical protein